MELNRSILKEAVACGLGSDLQVEAIACFRFVVMAQGH